ATIAATYGCGRVSQRRLTDSVARNAAAPVRVSAAEYLEPSARPAETPVASHHPHAAWPSERSAGIRHATEPSNAAKSGPSGSTQLPAVTPSTGTIFSTTAAHSPDSGSKSSAVIRYISHVVNPKSAIKGNRTTTALSLPVRRAIPHA